MNTLYIHIPFCERKCFYCSFVVSIGQEHRIDQYMECLEKEAQQYKDETIESVYIGGGTPTFMSEEQIQKLFEIIHKNFNLLPNAEWTIEANPEGLDRSKLNALKEGGINRISLGVQSLSDKYLKILGRNHDSKSAINAFDMIRTAGFMNVNVDLMFSFPRQTLDELKDDVKAITQLDSEHLSLYTLSVEKNSKFYVQNVQLQDDHAQADQYLFVCNALNEKGYEQYEVSNFAKPGLISQHNMNYWQGGHYIGLGIGAHSHIGRRRSWNVSKLNDYLSRMQKGLSVEGGSEELTSEIKMKEVMLFGLRMNCGVDIKEIEGRFGCMVDAEQQKKIDQYLESGFLIEDQGVLKASSKGRLVLDELCAQLV